MTATTSRLPQSARPTKRTSASAPRGPGYYLDGTFYPTESSDPLNGKSLTLRCAAGAEGCFFAPPDPNHRPDPHRARHPGGHGQRYRHVLPASPRRDTRAERVGDHQPAGEHRRSGADVGRRRGAARAAGAGALHSDRHRVDLGRRHHLDDSDRRRELGTRSASRSSPPPTSATPIVPAAPTRPRPRCTSPPSTRSTGPLGLLSRASSSRPCPRRRSASFARPPCWSRTTASRTPPAPAAEPPAPATDPPSGHVLRQNAAVNRRKRPLDDCRAHRAARIARRVTRDA